MAENDKGRERIVIRESGGSGAYVVAIVILIGIIVLILFFGTNLFGGRQNPIIEFPSRIDVNVNQQSSE